MDRESKISKKRKRAKSDEGQSQVHVKSSKLMTVQEVQELAADIPRSPRNFNSIATLLTLAQEVDPLASQALTSLCQVFSVFWANGRFSRSKTANTNEQTVIEWLRKRSDEFEHLLGSRIKSSNSKRQRHAISIYIQLIKAQLSSGKRSWTEAWTGKCYFTNFISLIFSCNDTNPVCIFAEGFGNKYADVKFYTFKTLRKCLDEEDFKDFETQTSGNAIAFLEHLTPLSSDAKDWKYLCEYSAEQKKFKKPPNRSSEIKKQAQNATAKLLARNLSPGQRKSILKILTQVVVPYLHTPGHILDFLTDSFNTGGSTSLLALSGLYELMTKYNFDYPSFYPKLYSLLDQTLLYSAHRSQSFRLLNEFLASSHLPAAMVASFVKRLSRLVLLGPPAAVVALVPWIYNMLKMHPSCTFMVHREPRCKEERNLIEAEGAEDPFRMQEIDPVNTGAIDSCLWELDTLQNHFHPNAASLAKVISQEFRKQSYNLEDFLDHSYNSLVASDLGKEMKKAPVVEYEIPKQIFTAPDGESTLGDFMKEMLA